MAVLLRTANEQETRTRERGGVGQTAQGRLREKTPQHSFYSGVCQARRQATRPHSLAQKQTMRNAQQQQTTRVRLCRFKKTLQTCLIEVTLCTYLRPLGTTKRNEKHNNNNNNNDGWVLD